MTNILIGIIMALMIFLFYATMCTIMLYFSAVWLFSEKKKEQKSQEDKNLMDKYNSINHEGDK